MDHRNLDRAGLPVLIVGLLWLVAPWIVLAVGIVVAIERGLDAAGPWLAVAGLWWIANLVAFRDLK